MVRWLDLKKQFLVREKGKHEVYGTYLDLNQHSKLPSRNNLVFPRGESSGRSNLFPVQGRETVSTADQTKIKLMNAMQT
jgi:hypothetical protein